MSSFNLCGIFRSILIRKQRPINVARVQCGTVGLNSTRIYCDGNEHIRGQKKTHYHLLLASVSIMASAGSTYHLHIVTGRLQNENALLVDDVQVLQR